MSEKKIDNHTLGIAAISLSKCLAAARIPYALMGGYELVLLGANRTSKDLDVEIDSSCTTFEQVIDAFDADPEFAVVPGTRRDAVRVLWTSRVGIDVFLRPGRFPPEILHIKVMNPHTSYFHSVPFFQPTDLLIEKIKCTSERRKEIDADDVRFIFDTLAVQQKKVDMRVVRAGVAPAQVEGMVKNHPALGYIAQSLLRNA
ncbi:uncharacterized protein EI90DRAFT_3017788 [Cantharellus anzutake]|uniref:uncharacterized protein n=1 Tax=Cantharellus anzutake TaxID=1750568 RepID=UPI001907CAD4|nr:uncharacterized protein EI90DRAFT_3017788 [Cantharellus anzutake]KAF8328111.1 hypothetical protein EI90DRAFT_3017788 [Cantharellus anzutake]